MASDLTQEELDAIAAQVDAEPPMTDAQIEAELAKMNGPAPASKGRLQL